eukprot:CAMPEP_0174833666 /NCGR_PEP_ID=MMETSP1114-20130205/4373_1 /TAXON_ID=312471 /ORGANISM="Neobodo designis, Strain CCAP 1951/1" /LENGTH=191 /DNA_ID=CAMNT_0016067557 /DNA_START=51 /DNA_END=626 /DNA_ORIENTATION=+
MSAAPETTSPAVKAHRPESAEEKKPAPAPAAPPLNPKRVYWAAKVDDEGFNALTAGVHALIAETGFTQLVPKAGEFHATLLFMGKDRSKEGPIVPLDGRRSVLRVTSVVVTPRLACAAVAIEDPEVAAVSHNACPHLTLALAPKVPAKESNDVLEAVKAGKAGADWKVLPAMPSGTGGEPICAVNSVVTAM